jgi:hypothetical protein
MYTRLGGTTEIWVSLDIATRAAIFAQLGGIGANVDEEDLALHNHGCRVVL